MRAAALRMSGPPFLKVWRKSGGSRRPSSGATSVCIGAGPPIDKPHACTGLPHGRLFLFAALSVLAVSVAHPQRHLKTLGAVSEIPAGAGSRSLMTGDFNGDGLTGVAAAGDNGITVLYQRPESLRWDQTTLSVNKPILASAAGRCNRDRMTDIAVITDDPPQLRVYLARPGEKFVSAWTTALSALFSNLLVADLDNDGRPDIVLRSEERRGGE